MVHLPVSSDTLKRVFVSAQYVSSADKTKTA